MNGPHNWEAVPAELRALTRWGCWRLEERNGSPTKVPYDARTGRRASASNAQHWTDFESAVRAVQIADSKYDGVGFVFVASDGLVGIDLDDCVDVNGAVAPWARDVVNDVGSYAEISPSGTGIKIFLRGSLEGRKCRRRGSVEVYCTGRYFTVTGQHVPATPNSIVENRAALDRVYTRIFGQENHGRKPARAASRAPELAARDRVVELTDDEVIAHCRSAKNKDKFARLWAGDTTGYATESTGGHSEADLALCRLIAFFAGPNPEQIDRIFSQSGLRRDKWLSRDDYRSRTIEKALEGMADFCRPTGTSRDATKEAAKPERAAPDPVNGAGGIADALVKLVDEQQLELFHAPGADRTAYVTVPVDGHQETWRLRSRRFKSWLRHRYYAAVGLALNDQPLETAINTLEARGQFDGAEHDVHLRVGCKDRDGASTIYVDLGDSRWRAVEIDAHGWRVIERPGVRCRRTPATKPLPCPQRGGSIELLRPFVNAANEDAFRLLVGFALACFMPGGGYPILVLNGEAGSAKSSTARVLRALTDPASPPLRARPKSEQDIFIAASSNRVLAFDNLSSLSADFADSLCKLATGGGFGARKLYTDDEEVLIDVSCPVILTGIDDLTDREDFLSRTIKVVQPAIARDRRQSERMFWARFGAVSGKILGALFDGVSAALRHRDDENPTAAGPERLADFCQWVTGGERAFGWNPGSIVCAFRALQHDAAQISLESSLLGQAVLRLMETRAEWSGTATELRKVAGSLLGVDGRSRVPDGWPRSPGTVMGALRRVAEGLRERGIAFAQHRASDPSRMRVIVIQRSLKDFVQSVHSVQTPAVGQGQASAPDTVLRPESSSTVRGASLADTGGQCRSVNGTGLDAPDAMDA